jgi:orotidine-5'-phosphate decarboxylase
MNFAQLASEIRQKKSYLCVGLDPDMAKLPSHLLRYRNPILEFCKEIIAATSDLCVAYKPNLAFFEAQGAKGWTTLEKVMTHIPANQFTIADAKRGDIGNTSKLYATAFFEKMGFDAVTVAPYMGVDSVTPFLEYPDKWVILLVLTSNAGSSDFQLLPVGNQPLYIEVLKKAMTWGTPENMMFVVGATHPSELASIRALAPSTFFLVPGVGAQGGDLAAISKAALTKDGGLLVNASRSILYASNGKDFAVKAREEALRMQQEMAVLLADMKDKE